jgi:hypothetical protein
MPVQGRSVGLGSVSGWTHREKAKCVQSDTAWPNGAAARERELPESANSQRARTPRERELPSSANCQTAERPDLWKSSTRQRTQHPRNHDIPVVKRPVLLRRDSLGAKGGLQVSDCFLGSPRAISRERARSRPVRGSEARSVAALQSPFTAVWEFAPSGSSRRRGVRAFPVSLFLD